MDVDIFFIVCFNPVMHIFHITGVATYFGEQCEKNGLLVRVAGDNIMMSPPFIISPEEVDEVT